MTFLLPAGPGFPAAGPGRVSTIAAGTAAAAQTQTAALWSPTPTYTATPPVSRTPSLTPSLTPTFYFSLSTRIPAYKSPTPYGAATATGTQKDGCILLSQTPADGTHFARRASIAVAWKLKNTGSKVWQVNKVDFAFVSGTRMYQKQVYHLPVDIPVGEYVTMNVPMTAPNNDGTFLTIWSLRRGEGGYPNPDQEFCHVNLTIKVP